MNNLFFTALCLVLLYYCLVYLPQKSKANPPLKQNQAVQTEIEFNSDEKIKLEEKIVSLKADIQQKERTIIGLNNSYERLETKKEEKINDLKNQLAVVQTEKEVAEKLKQRLLEKINIFQKNKELIKELVEAHLDYIAYFLPDNFTPHQPAEIESKIQALTTEFKAAEEKAETTRLSKQLEVFVEIVKNERIVAECKELLEKLNETE